MKKLIKRLHLCPERWTLEEELDWRRWGRWHLEADCPPGHRMMPVIQECVFLCRCVCIVVCECLPAASAAELSSCADAPTAWTPLGSQTGSSSSLGRKTADASSWWPRWGSPESQWHHSFPLSSVDNWNLNCVCIFWGVGVFQVHVDLSPPGSPVWSSRRRTSHSADSGRLSPAGWCSCYWTASSDSSASFPKQHLSCDTNTHVTL